MTEALTIQSRDNLTLEADLDRATDAKATLVMCHPHPKMGGTMNAPLLLTIRDEMVSRGWNVLRFNFRGVGASQGEKSTGTAELNDALGAYDKAKEEGAPVALAGWSFGASVAMRLTGELDDLLGCGAIAPGIDPKPDITEGVPGDVSPRCPVFVLIGHNDDQVPPARAREWSTHHGATFEEVKGANHFFWAKYEVLTDLVANWLDERTA